MAVADTRRAEDREPRSLWARTRRMFGEGRAATAEDDL
jgi:hypothetical protein